jgi:general secretion pathway protein L
MPVNFDIKKITSITSTSTSKLKNIVRPLWTVLTFSPAEETISQKKSIAVSLEKGFMSVSYGSRFLSRLSIKGFRRYAFEEGKYPPPEGVASSLLLAINDFGAKGADISLSIPKAWTVIKIAEFPITVKESLANAISYELDRLTPFSPEEAFYDFRILKESAEKITILIVAAKGDLVRPYIGALGATGLPPSKVAVNLSSIGALCQHVYNVRDFIFVEITKENYEGGIFLDSFLNGAFAEKFETDETQLKINTLKEKISSLMSAAPITSTLPTLIVLDRDTDPVLEDTMKHQFNLPVRIVRESDIPFKASGYQKEIPFSAVGETVASLSPHDDGLNLIKKGFEEKPRTPMTFTVVLIMVLIAMWILYMIAPLRIEGKRLSELDRQLQLRKEDVRSVEALKTEIDDLRKEIAAVEDFKQNAPLTLDIMRELTMIIPKNTWLTRVRVSESTVNIEGYATSASTLLPKLEASNYFKKAEFASPTFRDKRMNADRFNIKMEIEGMQQTEETKQ